MGEKIPLLGTCETCPYWFRASEETGECRADPPKVFLFPVMAPTTKVMLDQQTQQQGGLQMIGQTVFPSTPAGSWCGIHPERLIEDEGAGPEVNAGKHVY
jgi:hypothetical protein